jgi:hypothetical protein
LAGSALNRQDKKEAENDGVFKKEDEQVWKIAQKIK